MLHYAEKFITALDEATTPDLHFSIVVFSDESEIVSNLTDATAATGSLSTIPFKGGYTNTGDAIRSCYETLKDSENDRAIVVVADGTSTIGDDFEERNKDNAKHHAYAVGQSRNAQDAHIAVLPVVIETGSVNMTLMEEIASGDTVVLEGYGALAAEESVEILLEKARCGSGDSYKEGSWTPVVVDTFEDGTSNWEFVGSTGGKKLIGNGKFNYSCPHDDDASNWCVILVDDTLTEGDNNPANDQYMLSPPVDVMGSTFARVTFSYAVYNWFDYGEHFHLDYSVDGGDSWVEHSYHISVHFNHAIEGHLEKWYKVPDNNVNMLFRIHADSTPGNSFMFIDNIIISTFVETMHY